MSETSIRNPILPGFNPDPSICRDGDDYYIATSTFEWFPGVQIHHSRDLIHWRLLTHPLDRLSLLSMAGNADSGGIWAPCLTRAKGLFWLIYTDVKTKSCAFLDGHNYLTTAPAITGPWSEPIYLNSSGFDPSVYHDDDGRIWLVNMRCDHRNGRNRFNGIMLQEYDPAARRLIGPIQRIFTGTALGCTEGPHLYRREGWYYLMTAEGGTSYGHAVTVARARHIAGPYEVDPANPILTSRHDPNVPLQKAGHASLVETPGGPYLVHLCGRPLLVAGQRRCILGRETAIQKMAWSGDGWLRLAGGGREPLVEVPAPGLPSHPFPPEPVRDEFTGAALSVHWQTPRLPAEPSWCRLDARPGWLRLTGRESPNSCFRQSLIARRIQHFSLRAQTRVDAAPDDYQYLAGLMALYDSSTWYYFRITHDEARGRVLGIIASTDRAYEEPDGVGVALDRPDPVHLKLTLHRDTLRFSWSWDGETWQSLGPELDAGRLSDEAGAGWRFTGAFVGLACHDLSGRRRHADFDYFDYEAVADASL